jgi:putative nucleotidyltransferase with HDIG domain
MDSLQERLNHLRVAVQQDQVIRVARQIFFVLLGGLFLLVNTALVGFDAFAAGAQSLTLAVGQVAPEDIRAPFSISYESAVMTNQRIQVAMNSVPDIYDPPDPSIAREQVQLARDILDYIADVRADEYGTPEMLAVDIQAITALELADEEIQAILNTISDRWAEIDQEVITVLERVMRDEIRDDNLRITRQNLPNLVSVRFRENEVTLITAIVEDLIRTNTFYNEERTAESRQAAAEAVTPEIRSFVQGQLVVRGGTIVAEADMEALTQLGLLQPEDRRLQEILSAFLAVMLVFFVCGLYIVRFYPDVARDSALMLLIGFIFVLVVAGVRLAGPERVVQPYLYPTASLGLLIATLVGPQIAIISTVAIGILLGVMTGGTLALAVMAVLGGVVGILALRNTERLNSYFLAGLLVALTNIGVVMVFYLAGYPADPIGALELIAAAAINGVVSGVVALAGLYLISSVLNIPTSLRLIELMQPSQQLLQRLLREAPGTYQHSLQVANLAELAAERVGANATLTRVGALYHDVGKMTAPHFFIENQADGVNPHDGLNDPYKSARIIIDHVHEGNKLARRYRLPGRIRDFILEHHGTTCPQYFYRQAVERAGGEEAHVDATLFTYPGPRPRSRETAILMLADSCESTVRARRPQNKQEIADAIEYIFDTRMQENQLDESGLTLRDLAVIKKVFVETLQGVFHPRIAYSKDDTQEMAPVSEAGLAKLAAEFAPVPDANPGDDQAAVEADAPSNDIVDAQTVDTEHHPGTSSL